MAEHLSLYIFSLPDCHQSQYVEVQTIYGFGSDFPTMNAYHLLVLAHIHYYEDIELNQSVS